MSLNVGICCPCGGADMSSSSSSVGASVPSARARAVERVGRRCVRDYSGILGSQYTVCSRNVRPFCLSMNTHTRAPRTPTGHDSRDGHAPHGGGDAGDANAIPRWPRTRDRARARGEIGNGDEEGDGCARVVRPSVRPSTTTTRGRDRGREDATGGEARTRRGGGRGVGAGVDAGGVFRGRGVGTEQLHDAGGGRAVV